MTAAVARTTPEELYVCVECDGTSVRVRESADNPANWDAVTPCYTSNNFTMDGGSLGFARTGCEIFIDNLTVSRWDGAAWAETMKDSFDLNSGYSEDRPEHDAAGNMTYDGIHKLTYDAWNKLCQVERAWRVSGRSH